MGKVNIFRILHLVSFNFKAQNMGCTNQIAVYKI